MSDRRAKRKQQTHDQIVDAAVELFVNRGYDSTTVDHIAAAADVARGTFFNYFPGKDDVTHAWIERRRDEVRDIISSAAGPDTITQIANGFAALCKRYDNESAIRRPMVCTWIRCGGPFGVGHGRTAEAIEALLKEGQHRGEVPDSLDAATAGRVVQDVYIGALCRWAASERGSLRKHLLPALDLVLPALRT